MGRARPPLAHLIGLTEMSHGLPSSDRRHHFFAAISFSMALSSIASANSFFSLVFSSSSVFSRRASDTSSPPYRDFHLEKVEPLTHAYDKHPPSFHRPPAYAGSE